MARPPPKLTLRARTPHRVLDGFGRAVRADCRYLAPRSGDELAEVLRRATGEGLSVAFRGSGRSYGDPALNADGIVVDTSGMDRVLGWDPVAGVLEAEPGVTIEGVWRRTIEDGYWPHVVPGTMRPTLGGCLSMNIHGKNNWKAGPFGEHVLDFDLVTPRGELLRCSRDENADVFHGAIGGLGLLGAITRVRLSLHHVGTGNLSVTPLRTRHLEETFDVFEEYLPKSDYLVGWVDCMKGGRGLGRGQLHSARYLAPGEDPGGPDALHVERQGLPSTILGVPRSLLWRFMRPFSNDFAWTWVSAAKYHASWRGDRVPYLQSHVGFAFLLDYVPNWRLAYGPEGFIQHQIFVPYARGRAVLRDVLALCLKRGVPSYLGVLKRHRPDAFLLSHAVDGWSFAMDFRVTRASREKVWAVMNEITERVLEAGGRFYFAKDAVLTSDQTRRAYGEERLAKFALMKARLDPDGVLSSNLSRRTLALPMIGGGRAGDGNASERKEKVAKADELAAE